MRRCSTASGSPVRDVLWGAAVGCISSRSTHRLTVLPDYLLAEDLRTLFQEGDRAKRLRRSAEGVVWDVHYSPLCLRFYPWEIRIGCVCLASYLLDIEPPESWVTRNCMELPRLADFMASMMEYYLSFKEPVKGVESSVEPSPKRFRVGSADSPSAGGTPLDEPA